MRRLKPTLPLSFAIVAALAPAFIASCQGKASKKVINGSKDVAGTISQGDANGGSDEACSTYADDQGIVRRLSNREYSNTLRDAIGVDVASLVQKFPADDSSRGFANTFTRAPVSSLKVQKYFETAMTVAGVLSTNETFKKRFLGDCRTGNKCAEDYIKRLALFLMRRPVEADVAQRYALLFAKGGAFDKGVELVLAAMLQDPRFLYRIEQNDNKSQLVDAYELATRLSYFIWHSGPDLELLKAAGEGKLYDKDALTAQVDRMLKHENAERAFEEYVNEWLALGNLDNIQRDAAKFPGYSRELVADMRQEVISFFREEIFKADQPLSKIFNAESTYATGRLASFYGWTPKGDGEQKYNLKEDSKRQGVLTMAGILAGLSPSEEISPVRRGLYFASKFLCQEIPPPPPDAGAFSSELKERSDLTPKERFAEHRRNASCDSCHRIMDPFGLGLENYDSLARYRDTYEAINKPIDPKGQMVVGSETIPFNNPQEMGDIMSKHALAQECWVRTVFQYAVGHKPDKAGACLVNNIKKPFESGNSSYKALIHAVVQDANFRSLSSAGK